MPSSAPTVLLAVHQGFAARWLLRTGVLEGLERAGAKVVVLTPNADEPYLAAEFPDVVFEPLRATGFEVAKGSKAWWLALHLRMYSLGKGNESEALLSKHAGFHRRLVPDHPFVARGLDLGLRALRRSKPLRQALLAVERRRWVPRLHEDVYVRHRPDVVVTTSPGWFPSDAVVLREAAAHGVPAAAVIAGWDNPTSKGYRGADPELVVVWSDRMAEQLRRHHDVPPARIAVEGVPHFDRYVAPGALWSRGEVVERCGLDPRRRTVLFATSTPGQWDHNVELAEALAQAMAPGAPLEDCQLVVRLHPIHLRSDHTPPLTELEGIRDRHPHVHLDVPDVVSDRLRCDLSDEDNVRFSSLLASADVLVCMYSTTSLEAFLADVPVVFAAASAHSDDPDAVAPGRQWGEFTHLTPILEQGAVRVGRTRSELIAHVRTYLDDPALDRDARLRVAELECGPTDGHAAARIAARILRLAGAAPVDRAAPGLVPPVTARSR